jgi:hypothetical protein
MKIALLFFGSSVAGLRRVLFFSESLSSSFEVELFKLNREKYSVIGRIFFELKTLMRLFNTDTKIIHLNDLSLLMPFFVKILKRSGKKVIYDTGNIHHETLKIAGRNRLVAISVGFLEDLLIRNSNILISRGVYLKETLEKKRKPPFAVYYIPDPVDVSYIQKFNKEYARNRFGIPQDFFIIGYVANFLTINAYGKKVPRGWELLQIVSRFKRSSVTNVRVLFVGQGPGLAKLIQLSQDLGVKECCIFTNEVTEEELALYLNSIDIGFMEDYDNMQYKTSIGAKVQEYMAAGKVVVTGTNPEKHFLLKKSQGMSFLFKPPNVERKLNLTSYIDELWRIFLEIYQNASELSIYGELNLERARALFDNSAVSDSLIKLYRKIFI